MKLTYAAISERLIAQMRVLGSIPSALRVAAWTIAAFLIVSSAIGLNEPQAASRDTPPDDPPSGVRYIAPQKLSDIGGFLPPPARPDQFNVAWIGASDVKLGSVSIPGAVSNSISTVGGRSMVIDSYAINGMRTVDQYRAVRAAIQADADAIVMSLGPSLLVDAASVRGFPNLDARSFGSTPLSWTTLPTAVFVSPSSAGLWRVGYETSPVVRRRNALNERLREFFEPVDLLTARPAEAGPLREPDPRLEGDATSFWLRQFDASLAEATIERRLTGILTGIGGSSEVGRSVIDAMLDDLADADIPVFAYTVPLSPAYFSDPRYAETVVELEQRWAAVFADVDDPLLELRAEMLSRRLPADAPYFDPTHPSDPRPLADVIAPAICEHWTTANPDWTCEP